MTRPLIATVLIATASLAASVATAHGHGVKIVVRGGSTAVTSSKTVIVPRAMVAPRTFVRESVFSPRFIPDVPTVVTPGTVLRHHHPHTVVVAPQCVQLPGSWSYVWVPQTYTYNVWSPGHWSPEGTWVAGHYAPYTHSTGHYQPVWVPGRFTC